MSTTPTDVFKSGAKRDPSFTDSPGEKLATSTNQQEKKLKGPAWAAAQGGASLTWPGQGLVLSRKKKGGRKEGEPKYDSRESYQRGKLSIKLSVAATKTSLLFQLDAGRFLVRILSE
jgi:hypothetical protein